MAVRVGEDRLTVMVADGLGHGPMAAQASTAATNVFGVAEGGVGYSYDEHNRKILTPEMKQRLDQARADIISGKIKVTEYKAQ